MAQAKFDQRFNDILSKLLLTVLLHLIIHSRRQFKFFKGHDDSNQRL